MSWSALVSSESLFTLPHRIDLSTSQQTLLGAHNDAVRCVKWSDEASACSPTLLLRRTAMTAHRRPLDGIMGQDALPLRSSSTTSADNALGRSRLSIASKSLQLRYIRQ